MAASTPIGWVIGGAVLLLAALAGASESGSSDAAEPKGPAPKPRRPKPAPQPATLPELLAARHQVGFEKGKKKWEAQKAAVLKEAEQLQKQGDQNEPTEGAKAVAGALGVAAAAAQSIPIVGNAVGLLLTAVALLVRYAPRAALLPRIEGSDFTGWRDDCFWYHDIPIYGPAADKMLVPMPHPFLGDNSQTYNGLLRLCAYFPNGPAWPVEIKVFGTGKTDDSYYDYEYLFNPYNPGDLSVEEQALEHVKGMQVYQPEDITPTGPRNFDPADPLGWKVPGERRSKLGDVPQAVRPGDLL